MRTHAHAAVLYYAKIHQLGGWDDGNVTKANAHHRNFPQPRRQVEEDDLHLVLVQPEEITVHSALNVSDAADHLPYYVAKVGLVWVERIVQLYIIGLDNFAERCRVDREQL